MDKNKAEARKLRMEILRDVYANESGKKFLVMLMNYCHYWTPSSALIKMGFDPREIVALHDVIKNCLFSNMSAEQIAGLIKYINKNDIE